MYNGKAMWAMIALITLILTAISFFFQIFIFASLEESYIFLYDLDDIAMSLSSPGGAAQLLASFFTQFMRFLWVGPLISAIIYLLIIVSLTKCCTFRSPLIAVLASVPCFCLVMCLESSAYKYQGHTALLICCALLLVYASYSRKANAWSRTLFGATLCAIGYYVAGSAAVFAAAGCLITDIVNLRHRWYLGFLYPLIALALGWLSYEEGLVYTLEMALTPAMYYDLNSTSFMMLYALTSMALFMTLTYPASQSSSKVTVKGWVITGAAAVAVGIICVNVYPRVHGHSHYQGLQMRHYAVNEKWDRICALPYDGSATPFTSYRFLAMAKQGILADNIRNYRPFIDYFFTNKPLVKKSDQQVLSDIYYQCDYMSAARKAAFDTDIVTSGEFNPVETRKLVVIHLAYGNYRVAEKLIRLLEKTAFYRSWATEMRKYLDNDALVESDPCLGPKRRAIPAENNYMSPKGLQRELQYVISSNPNQTTARQMLEAFLILTNQK